MSFSCLLKIAQRDGAGLAGLPVLPGTAGRAGGAAGKSAWARQSSALCPSSGIHMSPCPRHVPFPHLSLWLALAARPCWGGHFTTGVTLGLGWLPGEVPTLGGGLGEMLLLGVRVCVLVWSGGSVSG